MMDDGRVKLITDKDGRPRLPKERKEEIAAAIVALRFEGEFEEPNLKVHALDTLNQLISATSTDRSCLSCDRYSMDGRCDHWRQTVPEEHRERGCDQHQALGVPF